MYDIVITFQFYLEISSIDLVTSIFTTNSELTYIICVYYVKYFKFLIKLSTLVNSVSLYFVSGVFNSYQISTTTDSSSIDTQCTMTTDTSCLTIKYTGVLSTP